MLSFICTLCAPDCLGERWRLVVRVSSRIRLAYCTASVAYTHSTHNREATLVICSLSLSLHSFSFSLTRFSLSFTRSTLTRGHSLILTVCTRSLVSFVVSLSLSVFHLLSLSLVFFDSHSLSSLAFIVSLSHSLSPSLTQLSLSLHTHCVPLSLVMISLTHSFLSPSLITRSLTLCLPRVLSF